MKLLVINNMSSGYGDGAIYDFMRHFEQDGDELVLRSTSGQTDIRTLLYDAHTFDAVVASGGDGTVTTVAYALAHSGVPILPFPAGTANLLALNMLSPNEPHALAKLVREGKTLDFDIAELNIDGNTYGFGNIAGAGWDATIMKAALSSKRILGPGAYFAAALENPRPELSHFTITLDDTVIERDGLAVLIINFSKIQFDISLVANNRPRDGWLDVVVLKADNALKLIPALKDAILNQNGHYSTRSDIMEVHRAKHVSVVSDPPVEIQYDGEVTNIARPFSARILPHAARFIISDEGYSMYEKE